MSHVVQGWSVAVPLLLAVAGSAVGFAYFEVLRRTAGLLARGDRLWPAALTTGRVVLAALFFAAAARLGAAALLAAFGGFLAARVVMVRIVRRSS